jgi:hypothetical protein
MLGYEMSEIKGNQASFLSLIHTDDLQAALNDLHNYFENHKPLHGSYRLRLKSGDFRKFQLKATTVRTVHGKPLRTVFLIRGMRED